MHDILLLAVLAGPDNLLRLHLVRSEKRAVLRLDGGRRVDKRINAAFHQLFTSVDGFAQPFVVFVVLGVPCLACGGIDLVIFPVGPFEQADARFDSQRNPFVDFDIVDPLFRGIAVIAGEIQVFQNFVHDIFPTVTRLVERFLVGRFDDIVVPRYATECFDQFEIVPCSPETGHSFVVSEGLFAYTLRFVHTLEEGVDVVDEIPRTCGPSALQRGVPGRLEKVGRGIDDLYDVTVAIAERQVGCRRKIIVDKSVRIFFQRGFVFEIYVGTDLLNRLSVEEIFAGCQGQTS